MTEAILDVFRRRTAANGAALFDYTDAEWEAINSSIRHLREDLHRAAKVRLLVSSRDYLSEINEGPIRAEQKRLAVRNWNRIARSSEKLRALLSVCAEQIPNPPSPDTGAPLDSPFKQFLDALFGLQVRANSMAVRYGERIDEFVDFFERESPRVKYQFVVLNVWTEIGGKLQLSRHPRNGTIKGPLARYFSAVTRPVMGDHAPSLESLPDILRRQKLMRARLEKWRIDREVAYAEAEAEAEGRRRGFVRFGGRASFDRWSVLEQEWGSG